MVNIKSLQEFLDKRIPISKAMAIEVTEASPDGVTLTAPLEPNLNHRDTGFGGSASALAILSAWMLVYVRLRDSYPQARIVIQRNTIDYERPITGAFTASSFAIGPEVWERFANALARKTRARIHVSSILRCLGERVGMLEAAFVADRSPI